MASINEVTIDLKFTGLNNLEQATKKMRQVQAEVKRLAKEEKAGALSSTQYASRVGDLVSQLQKTTGNYKESTESVYAFSRAVKELISATDEAKNSQLAVNEARDQARANKALRDQYEREAVALQRLQSQMDEHNRSLQEANLANKSAKESASAFKPVLEAIEQDIKMADQAARQYNDTLLGVEKGFKSARESASAMSAALKEQETVAAQNKKTALAFGQLVSEVNSYKTANKSAEASMEVFVKQLDRVEKANLEVARSFGESVRAVQQTNLANKSAEASAEMFSQEIERLTVKFNPLYAASKRYEAQLEELNRAHQIGAINSKQYDAALEQLNAQLAMGNAATSQMSIANQHASRKINEVGMATQQVGYQVGDFLVQIQSGTNAFVAFGQQATQLVGILPMFASKLGMSVGSLIAISSGLGIAIPLATALGAAFMRTRQDSDAATGGIESFEDRLRSARQVIADTTRDIERMNQGFATTAEQTLAENVRRAKEEVRQAELALQGATLRGGRPRGISIEQAESNLKAARDALRLSEEELRVARERTQEQERLNALQDRRTFFAEQTMELQNQVRLYQVISQFGEESSQVEAERARQAREAYKLEAMREGLYGQMLVTLMEQYDAMVDAKLAGEGTADAVDRIDFGNALAGAEALARKLNSSLSVARMIVGMGGASGFGDEALDPRSPRYNPAAAREAKRQAELAAIRASFEEDTAVNTRDGGAGNANDNLRQSVDSLIASYDEQYAKSLKVAEATRLIAQAQMEGAIPANMNADQILQDYIASLENADNTMANFANNTAQQMSDAFMSIVDGSKSASDAFSDMARAILKQAFEMAVINPIMNSIFGGVSGFNVLPTFAKGGAFSNGNIIPFADGGVVSSPTTFPMSGSRTGLMGEAGPEAIMPLKRTKGGKLGVVAEGGGNVTVENHFHIAANGDDSVKKIIAQEAPKIASMTQKQIMDQRRRGGAMKATFG